MDDDEYEPSCEEEAFIRAFMSPNLDELDKLDRYIFAARESTNVLQEEDDENINLEEEVCEEEDKNLSLGMPVQSQEDDENDEQLKNEERELPPSPPMDEGNTNEYDIFSPPTIEEKSYFDDTMPPI